MDSYKFSSGKLRPPPRLHLAFFVPFLTARVWALGPVLLNIPEGISPTVALFGARGLVSDFTVAWLLSLALRRFEKHWLYILAVTSLAAAANLVHIQINAANADFFFHYLGLTPTFISGSVLNKDLFVHFIAEFGLSALMIAGLVRISRARSYQFLIPPFLLAAALAVLVGVPIKGEVPGWISANLIEENLVRIAWGATDGKRMREKDLPDQLKRRFFEADLTGTPRIHLPQTKQNVLFLAIEGLNRDDFNNGRYPRLKKRSESALYFYRFFAQQKQTDRGLYALTCGDFPNLLSKDSKTALLSQWGQPKKCLPKLLSENGYRTEFLQAAPLGFMSKDRFAAMAGYQTIKGMKSFSHIYSQNGWGVDDRTIFEQVLADIQNFKAMPSPWMIGVLTSGTHHPFNIPESEIGHSGASTHADAELYMDRYLDALLDALEKNGELRNTLVLVTGDEATPESEGTSIYDQFGYNRTFLLAFTPERDKARIEDVYAQSDLSLSVTDYLGLGEKAALGRSLFRSYERPRDLFFSNVFTEKIYRFIFSDKNPRLPASVLTCDYGLDHCATWSFPLESAKELPTEKKLVDETALVARYSDVTSDDSLSSLLYSESGTSYRGERYLLGSERFEGRKDEVFTWKVKLQAASTNPGPSVLSIWAYEPDVQNMVVKRNIFNRTITLLPGQSLDFEASYRVEKESEWIWANISILQSPGQETHVAEVSLRKSRGLAIGAKNDHEEIGPVVNGVTVNLLEHPIFQECARSLGKREWLSVNACPKFLNFLSSETFTFSAGQTVRLVAEVEVQDGDAEFAVGFIGRDQKTLIASSPQIVTSGHTGILTVVWPVREDGARAFSAALTVTQTGTSGRFRVRLAQLTVGSR